MDKKRLKEIEDHLERLWANSTIERHQRELLAEVRRLQLEAALSKAQLAEAIKSDLQHIEETKELKAEVDRLRALVPKAFAEGQLTFSKLYPGQGLKWEKSDTKKQLTPNDADTTFKPKGE
jgi:hypothetical protein